MSFFETSNALAEAGTTQPIAYAAAAGPMLAWKLAYEAQWRTSAMWGLERAFEQADEEQARAGRGTPDALGFPKLRDVADYAEIAAYFTDGDETAFGPEQQAALRHYDQAVERARKQGRPVKSARALWASVQERAQAAERAWERTPTTLGGSVSGFLGGAVAALDPRTDPLNFATLPLGGVGKTALWRVASQVGAQGAVEAVNQLTGVQENRRLLGLEHGFRQALTQVGAAAVGAGVLQGLGEGIAHGVRRWRARRADARPAAGRSVPPESPWRGTEGGAARTESDLAEIVEQLEAWEGPRAAAVEPKGGTQPVQVVAEEDPVTFQIYSDLERELAELAVRPRIDARRGEPTRVADEGGGEPADVKDLKAQQAALRPLLIRAYARSQGRFGPTEEDVTEVSRILRAGGARALGERPSSPHGNRGPEAPRANRGDSTFTPREPAVAELKLSNQGVEIPGFERPLAPDERVLVSGDEMMEALTVREVIEQNQADEVFLGALRGCQT